MTANGQGLLSVNEIKKLKMITELQKRFEADAYKQKMNYAGSAGIAAEQGFLAGIDFLQHLLQQTQCTTLREELEQMLKEENEALGKAGFYEQYKRETHANQRQALAGLLEGGLVSFLLDWVLGYLPTHQPTTF